MEKKDFLVISFLYLGMEILWVKAAQVDDCDKLGGGGTQVTSFSQFDAFCVVRFISLYPPRVRGVVNNYGHQGLEITLW